MKPTFYEGWNVDCYAQSQTLTKRKANVLGYSGDEPLALSIYDFMPEFPLEVRLASFDRRLSAAMARHV